VSIDLDMRLGAYSGAVRTRLSSWDLSGFAERLWLKDPTLWFPEQQPEITDRLGWLDLPDRFRRQLDELRSFGEEIAAEGYRHAVVLGMGGSSLAPEVYAALMGSKPGMPELLILDSTHPDAVAAVEAAADPASTVYIVASKSGGTLETLSFFRYFWAAVSKVSEEPGAHFVAITDAGSGLQRLAAEHGFRRTFLAPADVGGRYSALTEFGLVPAALIGADLVAMQATAEAMAERVGPAVPSSSNDGLRLGAVLGELALAGRDKVTFVTTDTYAAFPAWVEQLIAESTGKEQRGIIPIGGEAPATDLAVYGDDRLFILIQDATGRSLTALADQLDANGHPVVVITLSDPTEIVAAMFLLEVAVAAAGAIMGIHPFNQPDVQLAKDLAKRAMAGSLDTSRVVELDATQPDLADLLREWLEDVEVGEYVGIHAWLEPNPEYRTVLEEARIDVRDTRGIATTLDFGPRFLHSTGQLHKGGPNSGRFIQIIDHPTAALAVPETDYSFGDLIGAQALGDNQALVSRDRRVVLVCLGDDGKTALEAVAAALSRAAGPEAPRT
jgi:transaldolase/glucose-6-phosphate isomerase